jgi:hypothetical protein
VLEIASKRFVVNAKSCILNWWLIWEAGILQEVRFMEKRACKLFIFKPRKQSMNFGGRHITSASGLAQAFCPQSGHAFRPFANLGIFPRARRLRVSALPKPGAFMIARRLQTF